MALPPEYAWIELVAIGVFVVFVADLIGNMVIFHSRLLNAFATATVFMVAFALTIYLRFGSVLIQDWGFAMMRSPPA